MKIGQWFAVMLLSIITMPWDAHAVVGTSNPESWYVRPVGACSFNGDGLAYGCAGSNGAHGAFIGFPAIIRTTTVGVDDGDTLYVCGDHIQQLRIVTGSGSAGAPVKTDGQCPGDPGSIDTSSLGGNTDAILIQNVSYQTIRGFGTGNSKTGAYTHVGLRGSARFGIFVFTNGTDQRGFVIEDNIIDNRAARNATNICHAINFITSAPPLLHRELTVRRNVILGTYPDCAVVGGNSDGIHVEDSEGPILIEHNYTTNATDGIDVSSGTAVGAIVQYNISTGNRNSGTKIHGGVMCPVGIQVIGNRLYGNGMWALIFQDARNGLVSNNLLLSGLPSGRETVNYGNPSSGCTVGNNSFLDNILATNYSYGVIRVNHGTRTQFELNTFTGNIYYQTGGLPNIIYFDADLTRHVTTSNFAIWGTLHPHDFYLDPLIVGIRSFDPAHSFIQRDGVLYVE